MIFTIALLFINTYSPVHGDQLHDFMTKEEKELIFRVDHDQVHTLNYEVVPFVTKCVRVKGSDEIQCPSSTSGFEKPSLYLNAFDENFELYLEENNNILFGDQTPVIKPYLDSSGKIKYDKRVNNLIPFLKISAYHDRNKRAAVTMYRDENGKINVNGIVNDTFIIRSIPQRLHEKVMDKNLNLSRPLSDFDQIDEVHHHIIIKRDIKNDVDYIKLKSMASSPDKEGLLIRKPRGLESQPSTSSSSNYRKFTVYPKILIVLDYATYLLNDKSVIECVRHIIAYWNIVDLRFREMEKPNIRLNIAGIIVATKSGVTPYMEGRKASATSRYDEKALSDLKKFFSKENVTHINYDIVVGISPWKLVEGGNWWQPIINWFTKTKLEDSVHGLAYMSTLCRVPRKAMALVRDGGDLFNANVATHEIGHILGANHDPEDLPEDDSKYKSDWKHGFIMSYARVNKNQMHWSDVSIREMQKFLQKGEHNYCVVLKPTVGKPYKKILPGKFVSRDEQCRILFGDASYSLKDSVKVINDCINSYCYSPANGTYMKASVSPAEGSFCGVKKICIEGECVKDPTDPIVYRDLSTKLGPKN